MALPININDLINGRTIESERIEYKEGWNPEDVIHTMCAFANDLQNWGGGYIIIGIAENDGNPIFPPKGLQQNQLDPIQKKILELGYKLQPTYFPIIQPYLYENKNILVLWCPAGDNKVYTSPVSLSGNSPREPYVRIGTNSIVARGEILRRLQELTARIPFDDRINYQAHLSDLDLGLIQAFLQEIQSRLLDESINLSFEELCRVMHIAKGPNEDIRPINAGLLFFCKHPERFFERAKIELVVHKDRTGTNFIEKYFTGPLHSQLRNTLSFIQTNIIKEIVIKQENKAESIRVYNYPFEAIEEALSNAVYHKSYEYNAPIEIQIYTDSITILSHPGPMPPVNSEMLATLKQITAREYRNRRIGDFLKELHLTEGRGTGLPKIYSSLSRNGSPEPKFETDDATYVLARIPMNPLFTSVDEDNRFRTTRFNSLKELIAFSNQPDELSSTHVNIIDRDQARDQAIDQAKDQVTDQVTDKGRDQAKGQTLDEVFVESKNDDDNIATEISQDAISIISNEIHKKVIEVLSILTDWKKRDELFLKLGLSNNSINRKKYLDPLIKIGWIVMKYPEKPTHPNQQYKSSKPGVRILKLIQQ